MFGWARVACDQIGIDPEALNFKKKFKKLASTRQFSFKTIHYLFIIGTAIITSVVIYGNGSNMAYIDALFFASGSATQSGLNTVDVNNLLLYQQIAIYLATFLCTPIFINEVVVWVRLYWFEKRFRDVVRDARSSRQSRTRSFARSFSRSSADVERGSNGVNGRRIEVIRNTLQPVEEVEGFSEKRTMSPVPESSSDSGSSSQVKPPAHSDGDMGPRDETLQSPRTIRFPDDLALKNNTDKHIAFVERQRNEADTKPLRIPGPREADEGAVPEEVEARLEDQDQDQEEDDDRPHGILKNRTESQSHSIRPNVTIEEPQRPLHHTGTDGRGHRRLPSNPYAYRTPTAPNDNDGTSTLRKRRSSMSSLRQSTTTDAVNQGTVSYLSWQPTVGRNSLFIDLTDEQRDELGGIEYRSLKTLSWFVMSYYIGFHVFGAIILIPWILRTAEYGQVVDADGQNRVWWAIFSAATFFNDLGFTLTPDSFISFQLSVLVMLLGSFLIVIGNTGFPCMLRFMIWLVWKIVPSGTPLKEELRFLLDHPRRCFTLLFPAAANWTLFLILVLLNGIDLIFFVILDINDPTVGDLPPAFKFLDGLFQAFSTRTAGTACVNVADLHPAIQVSYLVMMYISVLPIAISVRRTNVYEEQTLGVYSQFDEDKEGDSSYVSAHLRKQLSFDLWYIFLGLFIIAIAEGDRIADENQPAFTLFPILFEIVSAYGTVGLSLGYPGINASFSAEFSTVSKLVIIAMQIRGRHRGLPYDLDRAVQLPSEALHRTEMELGARRVRRASTLNLDEAGNEHAIFRQPTYNSVNEDANIARHESFVEVVRHRDVPEMLQDRPPVRRGVRETFAAAANPITAGRKVLSLVGSFAKID